MDLSLLASARSWAVVLLLTAVSASTVSAQSPGRAFNGPYIGADVGRQQVIGGALVDGLDTLQEDPRVVVSIFGGLRGQIAGFALGGELGFGRTDGDLVLEDPGRFLAVDYANSAQWHWMLTGGHTIGARTLLFGYLSEVSRDFDVSIRRSGAVTAQQDSQGLLRFGAGVEHAFAGPFALRVSAGTSRADFGDRQTNIEIGRHLEMSLGVVIQF
jgi:hypothetical protein